MSKSYFGTENKVNIASSNLTSMLSLAADAFEKRGSGAIIGISSVAGDRGRAANYVYGSAKAGLATFLAGLRNRLAGKGVQVITVKPGPAATAMPTDAAFMTAIKTSTTGTATPCRSPIKPLLTIYERKTSTSIRKHLLRIIALCHLQPDKIPLFIILRMVISRLFTFALPILCGSTIKPETT